MSTREDDRASYSFLVLVLLSYWKLVSDTQADETARTPARDSLPDVLLLFPCGWCFLLRDRLVYLVGRCDFHSFGFFFVWLCVLRQSAWYPMRPIIVYSACLVCRNRGSG